MFNRLVALTILVLKGNKPLELRARRRQQGWRELPVPAMSLIVFRHEVLMEFSRESLEFTCLPRLRQAGGSESRLPATCPAKAESEGG